MLLLCFLFLFILLLFPETAAEGSKSGLLLWAGVLVPSLLPFSVLTSLIRRTMQGRRCQYLLLAAGILSGYPIGAKVAGELYKDGMLSREKALFFAGFTNNPSPMFVIFFVAGSMLGMDSGQYLFYALVLLSSLLGSLCFLLFTKKSRLPRAKTVADAAPATAVPASPAVASSPTVVVSPSVPASPAVASNPTVVVSSSVPVSPSVPAVSGTPRVKSAESFSRMIDAEIASSALLLIKIGGYIMFFSIFATLLRQLPVIPYYAKLLLGSILEITTGDAMIAASPLSGHAKIILSLAATAFGGLSAAAQTNSVLQNTGLPFSRYVMIKVLAGSFGLLLGLIFF